MAGILIIAHAPLASALRDCAAHVYCGQPERLAAIDVLPDAEPAGVLAQARAKLDELIEDNGALVLTDIFGATPANIASRLADPGRVRVLAGVNLPMLVRAICYRAEKLDQLAAKALAGGSQGVLQVGSTAVQNQVANHPDKYAAEDITIINKLGLHARASAKLTQLASKFDSQIKMSRNGRQVDAKSIMGVMMLAAGIGSTVTLEIEGPDEQAAMDGLVALIGDRFGEGE